MKTAQSLTGIAALCGLVLAGPGSTTASAQWRNSDRRVDRDRVFQGDRFETMRALGQYLDQGTRFALAEATDTLARSGNRNDRDYLSALRSFAQRTADFNDRLNDYRSDPNRTDREVRSLLDEARRVDSRMRRVSSMRGLYDDWAAVIDGVNRMQQFVAGYDVTVPTLRPRWADRGTGDRDGRWNNGRWDNGQGRNGDYRTGDGRDGYPRSSDLGGFRGGYLSGRELGDFRNLSADLDTRIRRVVDMAERSRGYANDNRTAQMLSDLRNFAFQTSSLRERTRENSLDPSDVGPIVQHLLEDARATDRSLRQANAFSSVWSEWQSAISVMERMDAIVRR